MKKRKDFNLANTVKSSINQLPTPILRSSVPESKIILFGVNATTIRSYDFTKHYGKGFDCIVSAIQQTVEIILKENVIEVSTVTTYCNIGAKKLVAYLSICRRELGRDIDISDINIEFIEDYIQYLKRAYPNGGTAKNVYGASKPVLFKMQLMAWLERFDFPINPFPNSNRKSKGQLAFSKVERRRVTHALKNDVNLILKKTEPLSSYELAVCLLAIALRSGMNTAPLLEMTLDSIQEHPFKENRKLLVLYKRRGNSTHIQSIRQSQKVENFQTVLSDVAVIVENIINVNCGLREEIGSNLVFVYRAVGSASKGQVRSLGKTTFQYNISKWVKAHDIRNDNGGSLKVNISRFRKTFENRIWELSGGDPFVTASLANHSVNVSQTHYLEAPKEAVNNFNFMGIARTQELLNTVEFIANNTPVSKCTKLPKINKNGNNIYCTDFLSCVRCRNMIVSKEDLYRLFSFYWLLIYEREEIGAKRWRKYFAHIIRIIDRDIGPQFDEDYVKTIKSKAESKPHPAWKHRHQLEVKI